MKKIISKISFRIYIIIWFYICIALYHFMTGFYDGWTYGEMVESPTGAVPHTGVDEVFYLFFMIIAGMLFYSRIKKKVIQPIEELNANMIQVSQGNFETRMQGKAQFEFRQMKEIFNQMVEKLHLATKEKQLQEQKNQQLYASIAHDLKTPMTMVKGYSKALQQKMALTKEKEEEYLQTIVEQTDHANILLEELLAYTKLENQTYQLRCEQGDLAESLRTCVAGFYRELELNQMNLELEIPEEKILFSYDAVEMRRVFSNLMSNMIKHNPKETSCMIRLEQKEHKIQIVFADSGTKINKELEETLFEPFSVSDGSRNTKNGSGLGLSISKKIVERHKGIIDYKGEYVNGYKAFVIEFVI